MVEPVMAELQSCVGDSHKILLTGSLQDASQPRSNTRYASAQALPSQRKTLFATSSALPSPSTSPTAGSEARKILGLAAAITAPVRPFKTTPLLPMISGLPSLSRS